MLSGIRESGLWKAITAHRNGVHMSTNQSPLRSVRLATEFAVIVVGVFIAVLAESWWSEREDRRYERELREDMVTEFEANLRIVEVDLAANDTAHARVTSFAELGEDELESMSSEAVTAAIGGWLDWSGFDPQMGSAQALVESGNVGAISDRRLDCCSHNGPGFSKRSGGSICKQWISRCTGSFLSSHKHRPTESGPRRSAEKLGSFSVPSDSFRRP